MSKKEKRYLKHAEVSGIVFETKAKKKGDKADIQKGKMLNWRRNTPILSLSKRAKTETNQKNSVFLK